MVSRQKFEGLLPETLVCKNSGTQLRPFCRVRLNRVEGHYVRGFGDGKNKPETPLELIGEAAAEVETFLEAQPASQIRLGHVAALIEGYETPFGTARLSSVHWVATHSPDATRVGRRTRVR